MRKNVTVSPAEHKVIDAGRVLETSMFKQTRAKRVFVPFFRVCLSSLIRSPIPVTSGNRSFLLQYLVGRKGILTHIAAWVISLNKGTKPGSQGIITKLSRSINQGPRLQTSSLSMGVRELNYVPAIIFVANSKLTLKEMTPQPSHIRSNLRTRKAIIIEFSTKQFWLAFRNYDL